MLVIHSISFPGTAADPKLQFDFKLQDEDGKNLFNSVYSTHLHKFFSIDIDFPAEMLDQLPLNTFIRITLEGFNYEKGSFEILVETGE
jgi:hypothetical protein